MKLAPICLFTYKRLNAAKCSVEALKNCELASMSDLIIFSDGPKHLDEFPIVESVRDYLKTVTGFKSVEVVTSAENMGLANSIISGVSKVVNRYGSVIVLEDDLVVSQNFLVFMNEALSFYASKGLFSISGFSLRLNIPLNSDVYFVRRASSWGWATWRSSWNQCDWTVSDYNHFKSNRKLRRDFNRWGSDLSRMLDRQMRGEIDSWAIRWCYSQFRLHMLTVVPRVSLVRNVGFGKFASNTIGVDRYPVKFDYGDFKEFCFASPFEDELVRRRFARYYNLPYRAFFSVIDRARRLFF